jgi:hypothetical protein
MVLAQLDTLYCNSHCSRCSPSCCGGCAGSSTKALKAVGYAARRAYFRDADRNRAPHCGVRQSLDLSRGTAPVVGGGRCGRARPTVLILRRLVERELKPALYAIIVLYLIDQVRAVVCFARSSAAAALRRRNDLRRIVSDLVPAIAARAGGACGVHAWAQLFCAQEKE